MVPTNEMNSRRLIRSSRRRSGSQKRKSEKNAKATAQPCAWQFPRSVRDGGGRYRRPIARLDAAATWRDSLSDKAAAPPAVGTEQRGSREICDGKSLADEIRAVLSF